MSGPLVGQCSPGEALSCYGAVWHLRVWERSFDGNMNAEQYVRILRENLEDSLEGLGLKKNFMIFQQNNDLKHTRKLAKSFFADESYTLLEWPPQSPDLYPIGNVW